MRKTDLLVLVLRVLGISGLLAIVPVFMPFDSLTAIHRWLGLGEMPSGPVVGYLARSLSAFYALFSVLCLLLAHNADHYRALVRWTGALLAVLGLLLLGIDLAAGLPWWWTVAEGPFSIAVGAAPPGVVRSNEARRGLLLPTAL